MRSREGPNTWFGDGVGVSGGLKTEIWEQTAQIAPGPHGNTHTQRLTETRTETHTQRHTETETQRQRRDRHRDRHTSTHR